MDAGSTGAYYCKTHYARGLYTGQFPKWLDLLKLQPGERVLDVGCGLGNWTAAMAESHALCVGLDISPDAVEGARQLHPKPEFLILDGHHLEQEFAAGSMDALTCMQVLEHIHPDRVDAYIGQLAAILRVGGRLLVNVPVTENLSDRWLMFRNQYIRGWDRPAGAIDSSFNPTHLWRIGSLGALTARFKAKDLETERIHKVFYVPWLLKRLGAEGFVASLPAGWQDQCLKGATILFRKGIPVKVTESVEFSAFWTDPPGTEGVAKLKKLLA